MQSSKRPSKIASMLSIILYGRNDNHGTNYHKRLALSLNCLAELLTAPDDEIVFADYNTPDEAPSLLEAIQDTLTEKAKYFIRIVRIRPSQLQTLQKKTHLPLLEPVARNVAIRNTNPANKWILSTNSDMIFVPFQTDETLTSIVSELREGFYLLPRFELPETFWEQSLDRLSPRENLTFLKTQYKKLHLNIITRRDGFLKFDNPGDFQLMLREDIFQIGGFDENMVKGWHVDSNLCKRISLFHNKIDSLENKLAAFHCNHTRNESILHSKGHTENNWGEFVANISTPFLQKQDWGLANECIEEIRLKKGPNQVHFEAVSSALSGIEETNYSFTLNAHLYNGLVCSSARILSYLADHFYHLPKLSNIAYFGYNTRLLHLLTSYLERVSFKGKIHYLKDWIHSDHPLHEPILLNDVEKAIPEVFIFDFGIDEDAQEGTYAMGRIKMKKVMDAFIKMMKFKENIKSHVKFIGINALRTDFYAIFEKHLSLRKNTYATGLIYGTIPRKNNPFSISNSHLKKNLKTNVYYFIVKYLYPYTNGILKFLSKKKISNRFLNKT